MKKAAAIVLLAATMATPGGTPGVSAHHRSSDRWERRHDHHHGRHAYRRDSSLSQHRRWHRFHADRGGSTGTRHRPGPKFRVESTAYCLRGRMANGQYTHTGAVAMNNIPLGTKFRILSGPKRGARVTVKDRIGHGSEFDVAMPGACRAARNYGRRVVNIRRV